jgi:hypothetical protein
MSAISVTFLPLGAVDVYNPEPYINPTIYTENKSRLHFDRGVNVNMKDEIVLYRACQPLNDKDLVKCLIDLSADVNTLDNEDQMSLLFASFYGHVDSGLFLLDGGADIFMKDNDGCQRCTILHGLRKTAINLSRC